MRRHVLNSVSKLQFREFRPLSVKTKYQRVHTIITYYSATSQFNMKQNHVRVSALLSC